MTTTSATEPTEVRKPFRSGGEIVGYLICVPLLAVLLIVVATNPRFGWDIVGQYFAAPIILQSIGTTLLLTVVSMAIGVILGIILAAMTGSKSFLVSGLAKGFVWFFRGTPLLVQLIFWFNIAALFPQFVVGGLSIDVNQIITPMFAAVLGLSLNEGAYMAEIVRGGLASVGTGQREAGESMGLTPRQTLVAVILPQAMRAIIPPTGNQVISMLKHTSLVSVLGVTELLHATQVVYSTNFQTIPLLIVASGWYLVMTTILTLGQFYLEKHFSRSVNRSTRTRRTPPPSTGSIDLLTGPLATVRPVAPLSQTESEIK